MKFLRFLLPAQTPLQVLKLGDLFILRERIFHTIMLFAAGMALIGAGFVIPRAVSEGTPETFILISGFLGLSLLLTLGRAIPYQVRALILLAALFLVGGYTVEFSGLAGNGKIILSFIPILAGLLLGLPAGILGLVVTTLTFLAFGYAMTNGLLPSPDPNLYANSAVFDDWISAVAYFVLLSVMVTISLVTFINNLQTRIVRQRELAGELEKERQNLETSVTQRTEDLAYRLNQIRSAAEISRSISSVLNLDDLIQQVVDLILSRFKLYYVGLFLIDETGKYAVLKAGTGSAGQEMLKRQHQLPVAGASMIGWATANRKPRIALDVGAEAVRFNNPYLPKTRSEMALPILSRGIPVGALTVQSDQPNAFDADDITILTSIADSLAVAIENANLFTTTQRNLEEIRSLNRRYLQQAWNEAISAKGVLDYTYQASTSQVSPEDSSVVRIPLTVRDQVIGEITLELGKDQLTEQDQTVVDAISTQTAQALENARLLEDVSRKALQEERLNSLAAVFSQASGVEEIIQSAILNLSQIPNVAEVSLHIMPTEEQAAPTPAIPSRKNGNGHHEAGSK